MYELPNEIVDLRKVGNYKIILEMLGYDSKYTTDHRKAKF